MSRPIVSGQANAVEFPEETPCFLIDTIDWDEARPPAVLQRMGDPVQGRCVGSTGCEDCRKE